MKWIMGWSIFLLNSSMGQCQLSSTPVACFTSLGAYSKNFTDVFSYTTNPAALASLKNSAIGLYDEKRFLLPSWNYFQAAGALVTSRGNFGAIINYTGFDEYRQLQAGVVHARKLGKSVDAGVQFNYNRIGIAGYGAAAAISVGIGSLFHITREWHAGIHIDNPVGGRLGNSQEKLPAIYSMGFGYEASEGVLVSAEIIKEENKPATVKAGIFYKFLPQVAARAGIEAATSSLWLGVSFYRKTYRFDLYTGYHPQLGISPGILLSVDFKSCHQQ